MGYDKKGEPKTSWNALGRNNGLKDPSFEHVPIVYKKWDELTTEEMTDAELLNYKQDVWDQYQANFVYYRKKRASKCTHSYTHTHTHKLMFLCMYVH